MGIYGNIDKLSGNLHISWKEVKIDHRTLKRFRDWRPQAAQKKEEVSWLNQMV